MGPFGVAALLAAAAVAAATPAAAASPPLGVRMNGTLAPGGCVRAEVPSAWIELCNETASGGWYRQTVQTAAGAADADQMYAAGYLEGYVSQGLIADALSNFPRGTPSAAVDSWFRRYDASLAAQVAAGEAAGDAYWTHVGLVRRQLQGLCDGYNARCKAAGAAGCPAGPMSWLAFVKLTPSMMDVAQAVLPPGDRPRWLDMAPAAAALLAARDTHCSAMVRLAAGGGDALVGHTTWGMYTSMARVAKTLRTSLRAAGTAAQRLEYTSYPGYLYSGDDFYVTSAGLAVVETTLNVFNTSVYDRLTPEGVVLTWTRGVVAARMAADAASFASLFGRHNSGTYNNMWLAVDYKRLGAPDGLLVVLEQAPGSVAVYDATARLAADGYVASYNIPRDAATYALLGYPAMRRQFGSLYSYEDAPRANIFRRNATLPEAGTPAGARALMRYNNWRHDPLSLGSPANAVASRFDLLPPGQGMAMGGIDSKVVSAAGVLGTAGYAAVSGPTRRQVPPFAWATSNFSASPHRGTPPEYLFDYVTLGA